MSQTRRTKGIDVPLKINSCTKHITGVTKYTTCGDVINMVLDKTVLGKENNIDSFGIFESSRGVERLLPGKSRILKVMRSWGTDSEYEFVFRKVNPVVYMPKISEAKRRKLTQRSHALPKLVAADDTRFQRITRTSPMYKSSPAKFRRLNNLGSVENNEFVKELHFEKSDDRTDYFSQNIVCGDSIGVHSGCSTSETSGGYSLLSSYFRETNSVNNNESPIQTKMVHSADVSVANNVNSVKYAIRKPLKSKALSSANLMEENSKMENGKTNISKHSGIKCGTTVTSCNLTRGHPVTCKNEPMKRHIELENDIKLKITMMDQKEGKEAILRKYFADYLMYQSPGYKSRVSHARQRGDGAESGCESSTRRRGDGSEYNDIPVKRTRRQVYAYANTSDSGQEDEDTEDFDTAFIDEGHHTVSEESVSVVEKLVDYSLSDDSEISDLCDVSAIHSSVSDVVRGVFEDQDVEDEDEAMESFMNTILQQSDNSDEGLSSMNSDAEKEILV